MCKGYVFHQRLQRRFSNWTSAQLVEYGKPGHKKSSAENRAFATWLLSARAGGDTALFFRGFAGRFNRDFDAFHEFVGERFILFQGLSRGFTALAEVVAINR